MEDVQTSPVKNDNQPIFHVSDDLLSKMQSLSIDPHENKHNFPKTSSITMLKKTKTTPLNSASSKEPGKSIKFLSLEESAELVKQKKFISKAITHVRASSYFSDDEDEEENDSSDDESGRRLGLSDDD